MVDEGSRLLPAIALYPASLLAALALAYALTRTPHLTGRFLILIIWLRYMMQLFYDVTHPPIFAGFSLNAMVSIGVCALGVFVVAHRLRAIGRFPLVLLLLCVIVLSGVINGAFAGMTATLLKWGYFFIVALCIYDCIQKDGDARILGPLLWVFAPPLLLQALSVAMGISKATESDGSVSYIGGFSHEAAFSMVLVTCFAVASLAPRLHPAVRAGLLVACVAGVFAANYRTALIALAPLAAGYLVFSSPRIFASRQRLFVGAAAVIVVVAGTAAASWLLRERMADIGIAFGGDSLFKPPDHFTASERSLFSGRFYLWSRYLDAYLSGDDLRILFGFGPDAWVSAFGLYAHNTIVSYLYEFGAVGAALIVLVWLSMLLRARAIANPWLRWQVLFAHVSFIVFNFATMPHWQLEGLILYGLICGYTLAATSPKRAAQAGPYAYVIQPLPATTSSGGAS